MRRDRRSELLDAGIYRYILDIFISEQGRSLFLVVLSFKAREECRMRIDYFYSSIRMSERQIAGCTDSNKCNGFRPLSNCIGIKRQINNRGGHD